MIVPAGQRAQLPFEALATSIVLARFAPAIATPVAKRIDQQLQGRFICKNGSAFSGRNVVCRIEAESGNVAERTDVTAPIGRSERIAAVFNQPEIMLASKVMTASRSKTFPNVWARRSPLSDCSGRLQVGSTSISYLGTVTSTKTGTRRF